MNKEKIRDVTISRVADYVQLLDSLDIDVGAISMYLLYDSYRQNSNSDKFNYENKKTFTPSNIKNEFRIHIDAAEKLLEFLGDFGLIEFKDNSSNSFNINSTSIINFVRFIEIFDHISNSEILSMLANEEFHQISFHFAVPSEFNELSSDLMSSLTRLVESADDEILIVTPFFNHFGVEVFVKRLARATSKGVNVSILTRETNEGNNVEQVRDIKEIIKKHGNKNRLNIYDYGTESGRLHAKSLVIDNTRAYIGSANMTSYSLQEAVEIGIIIDGDIVKKLITFFQVIKNYEKTKRIY